jgi:hypothetical protein
LLLIAGHLYFLRSFRPLVTVRAMRSAIPAPRQVGKCHHRVTVLYQEAAPPSTQKKPGLDNQAGLLVRNNIWVINKQ